MKKWSSAVPGNTAVSVIAGACTSCASALIGIAIIAMLVNRGAVAMQSIRFGTMCAHFIALFTGCLTAGFMKKEKVLYSIGILFALTYAICGSITILLYNGQFSGVIASLMFGVLGAMCATLIHLKHQNNHRHKKRRKIC